MVRVSRGYQTQWKTALTHKIAGIRELYEQLRPTKLYNARKTNSSEESDVRCRMFGRQTQESVAHVLSGCSALAQTKYLSRHKLALKILFFELQKDHQLIEAVPPWYSPTQPKPLYKNHQVAAHWDVPVYADHTEVRANRVDARIVDKERKTVTVLEMSCPWIENRKQKEEEKTCKYAPLCWEVKKQYPGSVKEMLGTERSRDVLRRMQKYVLSSGLNIARTFKVCCIKNTNVKNFIRILRIL